ncbi:MAG: hypothetical protein U1F49_09265 [Rubrivivax sp.]
MLHDALAQHAVHDARIGLEARAVLVVGAQRDQQRAAGGKQDAGQQPADPSEPRRTHASILALAPAAPRGHRRGAARRRGESP